MPPALTEFLIDASGFQIEEVRHLHPKENVDLSGLTLDGVDDDAARAVAEAIQRSFFGTQDYAVVARVPN